MVAIKILTRGDSEAATRELDLSAVEKVAYIYIYLSATYPAIGGAMTPWALGMGIHATYESIRSWTPFS